MALTACTAVTIPDADSLTVSGAWARPAEGMSAAYLQISNNGRSPVQLVGVTTPAAAAAELHETTMDDDVMRMRPVTAIAIPAGKTVRLEQGGSHIMLLDLVAPLVEGESIGLTLTFDNGVTVETVARVSTIPVTLAPDALTMQAETAVSAGTYLGQIVNPPVLVQDFSLPASREDITRLSDLAGHWRVIFFGYMHCPDFCPLTLVDYQKTKTLLDEQAEEVTFIFISVDAARDTPEAIQDYLAHFDPDFVGFAADDATLGRIQPDYGFYYERRLDSGSNAVYTIDHSTRSYLLDRAGVLRASFAYDTEPQAMAMALQWYLAHEQVPAISHHEGLHDGRIELAATD